MTAVNPQQPAAAAAPAAQAAVAGAAPQAPVTSTLQNLDQLSYQQLRTRQAELQDQRSQLAERRADVASRYERASGANREGIASRLNVMDHSMTQIEADLSSVGLAMVPKRPVTETRPPFSGNGNPNNVRGPILGVLAVLMLTVFVVVPASVRRAHRRWRAEFSGANPSMGIPDGAARLDRIEQAVDTIAVEIERVSENQRFMTRLMTETQLAGTLAAVKGSAEIAKATANEPPLGNG